MQVHAGIPIAEAAKQLGVGSRTLFKALRQRGVLSQNNIANRTYVISGDFVNEQRSAYKRGTRIQRWYTVALVTGRGMSLLQEIVSAMAANGEVVVAERLRQIPDQRGAVRRGDEVRRVGATTGTTLAMDTSRHTPGTRVSPSTV